MPIILPPNYNQVPRHPHQIEATQRAVLRGNMGFWMDMRTGKTRALIDTLVQLGAFPALIMCPLGVMPGWVNELKTMGFTDSQINKVRPLTNSGRIGPAINKLLNRNSLFNLVSLDNVYGFDAINIRRQYSTPAQLAAGYKPPRAPIALGLQDWKGMVVDESYRIANPETTITEYLLKQPRAPGQSRFCLSGSPASEAPFNFATQYIWMDGSFFRCTTPWEYMNKFWEYNEYIYEWKVRKYQHLRDIRDFVQSQGYTKTMDELGLGAKIFYSAREIAQTPAQTKMLNWLSIAVCYNHKETGDIKEMIPLVRSTFEYKTASGIDPFTDEIISYNKIIDVYEFYQDQPQPLLIVNKFVALVKATTEYFKKAGVRIESVYGKTPESERERIRVAFQAGELDIVSAQGAVIAEGKDYSRLGAIIFMSNDWSHNTRTQAEKRGNHTARTTPYSIIDLQTVGTNDKVLTNVLTQKKKDASFFIKEFNSRILNRNG